MPATVGLLLPAMAFVAASAGGLYLLVKWHTRRFAYRCAACGREFEISVGRNFVSPHWPTRGGGWKLLRCPGCGRRTRAAVTRKDRID